MKVKLHQYGSFVNTTDVLVAAHTDPVIQQITERQSIQAAELMDFLSYLHFRTGTQAAYSGGASEPHLQLCLTETWLTELSVEPKDVTLLLLGV